MEEEKTKEVEIKPKKRNALSFLLDAIKGVTLGISAAVPGLSAGTIAVAEKCYDTIVDSISDLRKQFKKNFFILLPYVLGLLIGAVLALVGIQKGYEAAPFTLTGLFSGLVVGSLPVALSELRKGNTPKEKKNHILPLLICFLIASGLGILTALMASSGNGFSLEKALNERAFYMYPLFLLAGAIAAGACVVPGISGSMSLMIMGLYYPILNTYTGSNAIWHSHDTKSIVSGLILFALLAIGAVLGIIFSSKIMKSLLSKHRVSTFYGILGLILGSVISMFINSSIFPKYLNNQIPVWDYVVGSILFLLSALAMFFFFSKQNKKKASDL